MFRVAELKLRIKQRKPKRERGILQ